MLGLNMLISDYVAQEVKKEGDGAQQGIYLQPRLGLRVSLCPGQTRGPDRRSPLKRYIGLARH